AAHAPHKPSPTAVDAEPLHLMVVDDNPDAANALASLLRQMGQQVVVFGDADSALRAAQHEHADAYILDIGLPGMDGYELARQLRKRADTKNAVLIALTGYGQYKDRTAALRAGFDHHFIKPVEGMELLEA